MSISKHFVKIQCVFFCLCKSKYLLVGLILITSCGVEANQNSLNSSLALNLNDTDNYLLSASERETLRGVYLTPSLNYKHENELEVFSISIQDSIEHYSISEFSGQYPDVAINYKKNMEQSVFSISANGNEQSTRISELKDSGSIEKVSSKRDSSGVMLKWSYQLSQRNLIAMSGTLQVVNFESILYADLKNSSSQLAWNYELSKNVSTYLSASVAEYKSKYISRFPYAPVLIQGILLCPPGSRLVSEVVCAEPNLNVGNALNATQSNSIQAGINWNLSERMKFSVAAGGAITNTEQKINLPEKVVKFGAPLDTDVVFGGIRSMSSEASLSTVDGELDYSFEAATAGVVFSRQILPSSTGTLRQNESVKINYRQLISEKNWVELALEYQSFLTLNANVLSATAVDRNIFIGSFKYGARLSESTSANFIIGYQQQRAPEINDFKAHAASAMFSVIYAPREWSW